MSEHELTIVARLFTRLRWPTVTTTWRHIGYGCDGAERFAQRLRDFGAVEVTVRHVDHQADEQRDAA